jgi:hypothetical protein
MFPRRLAVLVLVACAAAIGLAGRAEAQALTRTDDAGRTIGFDVRDPRADVDWFASVLRRAAHGAEIETVTVRIVAPDAISGACGADAAACYHGDRRGGVMIVPSTKDNSTLRTVLHEYAHHLDAATPVAGVPEPNGMPAWYRVREIAGLETRGLVGRDYSSGWDHAIGEIFAEDYAQLHVSGSTKIGWLPLPDDAVRRAVADDVTNLPAIGAVTPVVVVRRGVLEAGQERSLPFGQLGPGRRVTFTVALGGSPNAIGARAELRCAGKAFVKRLTRGARQVTIDRTNLGPARCSVALVSTSGVAQNYAVRLRLATTTPATTVTTHT